MPNGEIESIGEFWKESHVAVQQILAAEPVEGSVSALDYYAVPVTAALILLFFLLMFPMLSSGLFSTAASLFSTKRLLLVEDSSSMKSNREILLFFWVLILSFIAADTLIRFLLYTACVLLFLLLRRGCLAILGWVNRTSVFRTLDGFYHSYFSIWGATVFLAAAVHAAIPAIGLQNMALFVGTTAILALAGFIVSGYQLIISNGFSLSFWILYLCTLEILPLIIFMHYICLAR